MDLTAGGPYSGKYVGYGLSKGKLSLDLKYKVSQKQLEAENKVLVDQLTFGEKVDSPDATSLPVPLVVALLKDRKGRIDIDLPIRGDLNDPDFKYGKVVLSTLLNLLTKIVASPFSLMGKLIPDGGDEESLQFVAFPPGSTMMAEEELKKLEALAKGLEERPSLRLDITGTADPIRDRQALNRLKLQAEVQLMWQRERGTPSAKGEPIPINDEQRLIQHLYEAHQKKAIPSAVRPTDDAPAKPPTHEDMKQVLMAAMPLDEEGLRNLARQRADQAREQLTGEGKLADERVYLLDVDLNASDHEQIRSRLAIEAAP
jgi:outer membrane protein OmpA-like peptidoglycan-associated protein